MPLFAYDRTLPVTPLQNVNDVQKMFEQLRDFINGGIGGDNMMPQTITATQLGDESVSAESLTAEAAGILAVQRPGAAQRRQSYYKTNQAFAGTGTYQVLATQTFSPEFADDCLLFGAYVDNPSLSLTYSVDIRIDGYSCVPSITAALAPGSSGPVTLAEQGWLTTVKGFQWHLVPGLPPYRLDDPPKRKLELLCQAPNATSPSWGAVALYAMMFRISGSEFLP